MRSRSWYAAALLLCAATLVSLAFGQDAAQKKILPTDVLQFSAFERTPEQMDAFAATVVMPESKVAPFRPTMDEGAYRIMKQMQTPQQLRPSSSSAPLNAPVTGSKFAGPTECSGTGGCWIPPDVAGAFGGKMFVAVHNSMFVVRSKSGASKKLVSLNAFFGYATQTFFDPRVIYDATWNRFVVTAAAFPESSTVQVYAIAISQTSNPLGGWWIYLTNVGGLIGTNGFWDYPQLGLAQDAVLFTANVFKSTGFAGADLISVAKARLYNGLGFSVPVFTGLFGTLAPPNQLDQNAWAWLAAAPPGSGTIQMYALANGSNPGNEFLGGPYAVAGVAAYSVPPSAAQPGCGGGTNALDTSDNRFVNVGTQNGDLYYQAHSYSFGTATGRYYIIQGLSTFAPSILEQSSFWTSSTSSDFNVSIAADGAGRIVLNYSSVDTAGANPSVRFTGKLSGDPAISGAGGTTLFTSPSCLSGNFDPNFGLQRWGDYSQVSIDPLVPGQFWIDNETVVNSSTWGTEVGRVHF